MGNFSRNTFDPAKGYVAVRLQQGVPLVDADWNELQDVTRNELYDALSVGLPNALPPQLGAMSLTSVGTNDFQLTAGTAIIGGRPLRVPAAIRYTTQRYANAAIAAADGVQPVPPLTTPVADRVDHVILDLFEREIRSAEDASLVNDAIGVETAVRLRREVVLRVAEGGAPPAPPPGHTFVQLALMKRTANQASIPPLGFEELLPRPRPAGLREVPVPLVFQQVASGGSLTFGPWLANLGAGSTLVAFKPANASALGITPLHFPQGARLRTLRVRGVNAGGGSLSVTVRRIRLETGVFDDFAVGGVVGSGPFDRTFVGDVQFSRNIVDNTFFSYVLHAFAVASADFAELRGATITYLP